MAQVTGQNPDDRLTAYLSDLEEQIKALQNAEPRAIAFRDGTRRRVQIGRQDDGKYGLRIWNAAGVLMQDLTY